MLVSIAIKVKRLLENVTFSNILHWTITNPMDDFHLCHVTPSSNRRQCLVAAHHWHLVVVMATGDVGHCYIRLRRCSHSGRTVSGEGARRQAETCPG